MPKLPLHQLDPRIKSSVTDIENAKGTFVSATQRIDAIDSKIIQSKIRNLLQDMKVDMLEQRLMATVTALDQGGVLEFQTTTGIVSIDNYLINSTSSAITVTLNIPAIATAETKMYVSVAAEYDLATGAIGFWDVITTTVTITIPAGGLLVGWGVLYK